MLLKGNESFLVLCKPLQSSFEVVSEYC